MYPSYAKTRLRRLPVSSRAMPVCTSSCIAVPAF
jgi:hypothetical protein